MKSMQGQTMRNKSNIKRVRKFGFRARSGKNVLKKRRQKKRNKLSASLEYGSKMMKNKRFSRRK
jgi:ribosomal protein L34